MLCVGNDWGCWGKTTANDGQPQVEEEYKKVVVKKRVDERTLGVPLEHH
jgi:hypothetical protein